MKRMPLSGLAALLFILAASSSPPALSFGGEKISPRLARELEKLPADETRAVWIFFTDKGSDSAPVLRSALREREQTLRQRCLRRRAKVRPPDEIVDLQDLEVFPAYARLVAAGVRRVRTASRWLNALSVEATAAEVEALARLAPVLRLEAVAAFERTPSAPRHLASSPVTAVLNGPLAAMARAAMSVPR